MADYNVNKQSDNVWCKASKILATPADATHVVCRIPKETLVTNIIVVKTVAFSLPSAVVTIGFQGNNETADTDAFMSTVTFAPEDLGTVCIGQGKVLNSAGKYFEQAGAITVTTNDDGGTAGTFQVFVEYVQIRN